MPFSTPSERYKWMNLKTHRSWQEMTVAVGHTDGRSLALRANQAKPQVAKGSTGGARWGVNGHFKLLTGSHYVGHDGHKVGRRHLLARVQVCEPFTRELIFKTCCDLFQEKLMEEVKLFKPNHLTDTKTLHLLLEGWSEPHVVKRPLQESLLRFHLKLTLPVLFVKMRIATITVSVTIISGPSELR